VDLCSPVLTRAPRSCAASKAAIRPVREVSDAIKEAYPKPEISLPAAFYRAVGRLCSSLSGGCYERGTNTEQFGTLPDEDGRCEVNDSGAMD
jgi:hypothetical protein